LRGSGRLVGLLYGGEKLTEIAADAAPVYTALGPSGKSTGARRKRRPTAVTVSARAMHLGRAARARLFGRGNGNLGVDCFADFSIGPAAKGRTRWPARTAARKETL
jgi:hypothetical protein